jgi:hypothetical protein
MNSKAKRLDGSKTVKGRMLMENKNGQLRTERMLVGKTKWTATEKVGETIVSETDDENAAAAFRISTKEMVAFKPRCVLEIPFLDDCYLPFWRLPSGQCKVERDTVKHIYFDSLRIRWTAGADLC